MKVPTDNYRKKIVIFNNRILQKCNTNSESFHGYDITQSLPSVQNSHSSNFSEDDIMMSKIFVKKIIYQKRGKI